MTHGQHAHDEVEPQHHIHKMKTAAGITVEMDEPEMSRVFVKYFAFMQLLMMILYFAFCTYDDNTDPATPSSEQTGATEISQVYGMWQDVHIMIFIGFGFLMTFLQSYGFSALTLNFMTGAFAIQWGILCVGFFTSLWDADGKAGDMAKIPLHITQLVEGDFAAATALISLGAILGKATPAQTLSMVTFELIFYALNYKLAIVDMGVADVGGTLAIHTFGAYFGLAFSWVLTSDRAGGRPAAQKVDDHQLNTSLYHGDMFSMVGTLFLWCFWPSFVAVLASGNSRDRAIMHTVLSICASCLSALVCSSLWRPFHKFNMVDVQNATLAGGVSIGAVADHYLGGGGAILVGMAAGVLSTFGYVYIQPYLEEKLGLFDTCGVHNLHGMPGVLGGLASVVTAAMAGQKLYGDNVSDVFSKMGGGDGRSAADQAAAQFGGLIITLVIALASGAFTGFIVKQPALLDAPPEYFSDLTAFEVPDDFPTDNNVGRETNKDIPLTEMQMEQDIDP